MKDYKVSVEIDERGFAINVDCEDFDENDLPEILLALVEDIKKDAPKKKIKLPIIPLN